MTTPDLPARATGLPLLIALALCVGGAHAKPASGPGMGDRSQEQTAAPRAHDPSIAWEGGTYYIFSTGRGVSVHASHDMKTWELRPPVFAQAAAWCAQTIPGSGDYFWAPDISRFHGRWRLYYAVSTFGSNHSAIGLATNATLDPARPDYAWRDEGPVIESHRSDDWNAIDPQAALDEHGQPWLALGSFWSGIKLVKLDAATGKPDAAHPQLISLARRPRTPEIQGAIEAPFIYRHGGWFYLFCSFDFCCRGVASTYNIRVGRARRITGPYVDRDGTRMLDGGGTLVRAGAGRWRGTGHNAILHDGATDWLVYHAYDADDRGIAKLRVEPLAWGRDGWPVVNDQG